MFQDIDMYFFDPLELMKLNSETFGLENSQKISATKFMLAKINEQEEKEPELTRKELIALIQTRLKEVGCNPGPADGIWGRRTQAAAVTFAKKAGLPTSQEELITKVFIEKLSEAPANYCPKPKPITNKFLSGSWTYRSSCGSSLTKPKRFEMSFIKSNGNLSTYSTSGAFSYTTVVHERSSDRVNLGSVSYKRIRAAAGIVYRFSTKTCYLQISKN